MKKIYLSTILSLGMVFGLMAQTITVGAGALTSGTGDNGNPIYRSSAASAFNFSQSVQLYSAADLAAIGGPATISKVAFFKNNANTLSPGRTATVNVYLKNSSATALVGTQNFATWSSGATLVYTNAAFSQADFPVAAGFLTFDFSATPFVYSGGGLEVMVDWAINAGAGNPATGTFVWKYDASTAIKAVGTSASAAITSNLSTTQLRTYQAEITYTPLPACTGTPVSGTVNAPTSTCSAVNLSLTGTTLANGLTYQWQSAPTNAGPFTNIASATSSTYSTTQSTATSYQCVVTCTASGLSATSSPVNVTMNPILNCYCTSAAANAGDEDIGRFDLGAFTNGVVTVRKNVATAIGTYTDFKGLGPIPLQQTVPTASKVWIVNSLGTLYPTSAKIYIDYDQNGSFDPINELAYSGGPINQDAQPSDSVFVGNITAPATALLGNTVLRIVLVEDPDPINPCGNYGYGETEDYLVNIIAAPGCSGTPNVGTATSTVSAACVGTPFTLNVTGGSTGLGFSYQWESSPAGAGTFTNFGASQLVSTLNIPSQTVATDYRLITTCTNGGASSTSSIVSVSQNTLLQCYCPITNICSSTSTIDSVFITGTTLSHGQLGCSVNPSGGELYPASGSTTGSVTIGSSINLGVSVSASLIGSVWIDYNQNGTYEASEWTQLFLNSTAGVNTTSILIPNTAVAGLTGMRIRTRFSNNANGATDACIGMGSGEYADYGITLVAAPLCATPPVGGTISTATPSIVAGNSALLVATGSVGATYSWKISNSPSGPFVTFGSVNNDSLSVTGPAGVYYLRLYMSSPGCPTDSSNVLTLTINKIVGDDACDAIVLNTGANGPYNIAEATVQANEIVPPITTGTGLIGDQTGWAGSIPLNNTMWFKFVATTKKVRLRSNFGFTSNLDNDTEIALWAASACDSLVSAGHGGVTLLAANEDSATSDYNSVITGTTFCLTPGSTYYVQLDSYGTLTAGSQLNVIYEPITDSTATFTGLSPAYCESTIGVPLSAIPSGGNFTVNGAATSSFIPNAVGPNTITYTFGACAYSSSQIVTVNANPVASITPSAPSICAGGVTGITLTGAPAGGTFSVQSGAASALTGNVFNPATTGSWVIVYSFTNGAGCTDTAQIQFNVNCTVGLNDLSKGVATITAVPNPSNGSFDLNISNAADQATIKLLSFDGRLLSTKIVELNQDNTLKMNIANYANGIYFVNVSSGNVNKTIKITKQD